MFTLEPVLSVGFPEGGRAAMVKLSGSSLSLILDSFIRLSSFFLAMFSTCFLLADVWRRKEQLHREWWISTIIQEVRVSLDSSCLVGVIAHFSHLPCHAPQLKAFYICRKLHLIKLSYNADIRSQVCTFWNHLFGALCEQRRGRKEVSKFSLMDLFTYSSVC